MASDAQKFYFDGIIVSNPSVLDGAMHFRESGVPLQSVLDMIAKGKSAEEICELYPSLEPNDLGSLLLQIAKDNLLNNSPSPKSLVDKIKEAVGFLQKAVLVTGFISGFLYFVIPPAKRWIEVNISNRDAVYHLGVLIKDDDPHQHLAATQPKLSWENCKVDSEPGIQSDARINPNFYHTSWDGGASPQRPKLWNLPGQVIVADPKHIVPGRVVPEHLRDDWRQTLARWQGLLPDNSFFYSRRKTRPPYGSLETITLAKPNECLFVKAIDESVLDSVSKCDAMAVLKPHKRLNYWIRATKVSCD